MDIRTFDYVGPESVVDLIQENMPHLLTCLCSYYHRYDKDGNKSYDFSITITGTVHPGTNTESSRNLQEDVSDESILITLLPKIICALRLMHPGDIINTSKVASLFNITSDDVVTCLEILRHQESAIVKLLDSGSYRMLIEYGDLV